MREIRSIIDDKNVPSFLRFLEKFLNKNASSFVKNCLLCKVKMEMSEDDKALLERDNYFAALESQFKSITRKIDYKLSKSNINIATIRHGLNLLRRSEERNAISEAIINEKTQADIDNDFFVGQSQGPEHKRVIDTYILTETGQYLTKTSLYRPVTKKGDPRMWVNKIRDVDFRKH